MAASSAVAASPIENGDPSIAYGGWVSVNYPGSLDGNVRESSVKNDTITYGFNGTSFTWYTVAGPGEGVARLTLDGTQTWTLNLYSSSSTLETTAYNGFASGHHKLVIKVLGRHSAASQGNLVASNGISVNGKAPLNADSPRLVYDQWTTATSATASGGSLQSTAHKGSSVSLTFSGVGVTWVAATGPSYGLADVAIDGTDRGDVDLYSAAPTSQVDETYSGLANSTHTITVTAVGSHDASSTGNTIALDALIAIPQPTLTGISVTPANATLRQGGTQQYTATGNYSDGSTQDLTGQVAWSTSNTLNANISNTAGSQGLLTANGGSTAGLSIQVTATLGAVQGSTGLTMYCRLHSNGLGGTYSDCSPLGIPGNASTYSQTMALEAALSWGHGNSPQAFMCGSSAPFQYIESIDNTNGPSANWSYTNGTGAGLAGYVDTNPTGIANLCPVNTDAAWN